MQASSFKRILISGGRVIDPVNRIDAITDLYIESGKIASIEGQQGQAGQNTQADLRIDATGLTVCPGFVDLSVQLPEPGFEHKGTIASETKAAAAGGITSLCCTPNTTPVMDSPSVAGLIQDIARQHGYARVLPLGAMTKGLRGKQLSEMHYLKEAGCIAVTNLRRPLENNRVLLHCLEYAASLDIPVFFCSVDQALAQDGCVHNGRVSTHYGLKGIPASAETVALSRDLLLVEESGVRAHFGTLSCARSVELIAAGKARGLPISADVAMHQLLFTDRALESFDGMYHVQPPLRTEEDRLALVEGIRSGVIDAIRSDHQPHEKAAKMAPFAATEPGISGLETLLPGGLKLVAAQELELDRLIRALTSGAAAAAGLPSGTLTPGAAADLCIFNPDQDWIFAPANILSRGHNTPLLNQRLTGRVQYTLLAGRCVYQAPELAPIG